MKIGGGVNVKQQTKRDPDLPSKIHVYNCDNAEHVEAAIETLLMRLEPFGLIKKQGIQKEIDHRAVTEFKKKLTPEEHELLDLLLQTEISNNRAPYPHHSYDKLGAFLKALKEYDAQNGPKTRSVLQEPPNYFKSMEYERILNSWDPNSRTSLRRDLNFIQHVQNRTK